MEWKTKEYGSCWKKCRMFVLFGDESYASRTVVWVQEWLDQVEMGGDLGPDLENDRSVNYSRRLDED